MSTGYNWPDIFNLCLMRPIFLTINLIQIKGRGTRKYDFEVDFIDPQLKNQIGKKHKENFKMFDFYGNWEYFEEKINYDEVLKLPQLGISGKVS